MTIRFTPKFMLGMVAAAAMTTSVALSGCTNKESKADTISAEEETEYIIKANNVIMEDVANAQVKSDSINMLEAMKAQKMYDFNKLEKKYNLALQKRKEAEIILEGTKRVAPDEANEAEKKYKKVLEETQPVIDAYSKADKFNKSKEFRDLFKNKPLINIFNKYHYVVADAETLRHPFEDSMVDMSFEYDNKYVMIKPKLTDLDREVGTYKCKVPIHVFNIETGEEIVNRNEMAEAIRHICEFNSRRINNK